MSFNLRFVGLYGHFIGHVRTGHLMKIYKVITYFIFLTKHAWSSPLKIGIIKLENEWKI